MVTIWAIWLSQVTYELYTSNLEKRSRVRIEPELEDQGGFRPRRQTQDNIFALRNVIEKVWDRNQS